MPAKHKKDAPAKPAKKDKVKSPKRTQTLRKSFAMTEKNVPETADDVKKGHQSGFLSYLKSAKESAKNEISNQATTILASYKKMTGPEKRGMITSFLQKGGKKPGLEALYQSVISMEDTTTEGSWSGWATPMMIMKWYEVGGTKKTIPQHHPRKISGEINPWFNVALFLWKHVHKWGQRKH